MRDATVNAAALVGWSELLAGRGVQVSSLMGAGLDCLATNSDSSNYSNKHDTSISLKSFVEISEKMGELVPDASVGWLVGHQYDITQTGLLHRAISSSKKLGTALQRWCSYFFLLQDATEMAFSVEDGFAQLNYRILDPDIWPRHQDAMFSLGIIGQIICMAKGAEWESVELTLECAANQASQDLHQSVGAQIWFDGDANSIRFPASFLDLDLPCSGSNSDMSYLHRAAIAKRRSMPAVSRVSTYLFQCLANHDISQEKMARELGMSSRTVRRKLSGEGINFQELLDDCRLEQAIFEFRNRPNQNISQIALKLGYSEHSTFTRAFTRWAGISPHAYRKNLSPTLN